MTRIAKQAFSRAICMTFVTFGGSVTVEMLESIEWASITFTGARHRLRVRLDGTGAVGAAADFLAALPDLDIPIPGHIVADISLAGEERGDGGGHVVLELEALTIEDR